MSKVWRKAGETIGSLGFMGFFGFGVMSVFSWVLVIGGVAEVTTPIWVGCAALYSLLVGFGGFMIGDILGKK